jgi:hypothetical protein
MLNKPRLEAELIKLYTKSPITAKECANRWAIIYNEYVLTANAAATVRSTAADSVSRAALRATLLSIFIQNKGGQTPTQFAAAFQAAFITYWFTPPQTFVGGGGAIVTIVPPTLAAALVQVMVASAALRGENGQRQAAKSTAFAIDTWTRTITATVAPATPVLIT